MRIDLSGKVALVTGGTRGIGASLAQVLADAGAIVYISGSKPQTENPLFIQSDFSDESSVQDFLKKISELKIDILINNAGINKIDLVSDMQMGDYARIQKVNLEVPIRICQVVLTGMQKKKWGRILNISSIFGVVSKSKRAAYSTSKAGIVGFTRALALDCAQSGVLANVLSPGFIETELTRSVLRSEEIESLKQQIPMGRLGNPIDISRMALFLVSDLNSYMTGQNVIVDGGFTSV